MTLPVRFIAVVLILALAAPVSAQNPQPSTPSQSNVQAPPFNPRNFTDFAVVTGEQVGKIRVDQLLSDRDVRAAIAFYEPRKARVVPEAIVDARFRSVTAKEFFGVAFVPLIEAPAGGAAEAQHVIVILSRGAAIQSMKVVRVATGTVAVEAKELVVRDEHAVENGKVVAGKSKLKEALKCGALSCAPAATGCLVGGGAWIPCFCAWCGIAAVLCAAYAYEVLGL